MIIKQLQINQFVYKIFNNIHDKKSDTKHNKPLYILSHYGLIRTFSIERSEIKPLHSKEQYMIVYLNHFKIQDACIAHIYVQFLTDHLLISGL